MKHSATSMLGPVATLLALLLGAADARALDATWSGFATLGYAISDSPYTYQGSINERGTFRRDSLAGGQLDLRLAPQWTATVQAEIAPASDSDSAWVAKAAWAFLAWRPNNDWLVRAGRMRMPLYLYSESLDVGVATDMARLPYEMYSIAPTNDFGGVSVTRNFTVGQNDYSLDGYAGEARATARFWLRDGLPPVVPSGPEFQTVDVKVAGLVLTQRDSDLTWRIGAHSTLTRHADGNPLPTTFERVDVAPGVGYWQVDPSLPGPGVPTVDEIRNLAITAGAEWQIADAWRMSAEFVHMHQFDTQLGSDSNAGYIALFRQIGAYTPYISLSGQRSSNALLQWRLNLTGQPLPAAVPGAAQINAVDRIAGEELYAFDQHSLALGLAWAISPNAKLKVELMRTFVGAASAHFDTPAGMPDARGLGVNTLSVNYSVAF